MKPRADAWLAALAGLAASIALLVLLPLAPALAGIVLTVVLAYLALIDSRTRLLPDRLTLPLIVAGLGLSLTGLPPGPLAAAAGAVVGYAVIAGLASAYRSTRGIEGIGLGDAKLLSALGAWTGIAALPVIVLVAALTALVAYGLSRRPSIFDSRHALPFGPFLAVAGWLAFVVVHRQLDIPRLITSALFGQ